MSTQEKDNYFVAIKVFIKKDEKLLILKDSFGDWDLPGGRIQSDEFEASLESILRRKIEEELGADASVTFGQMPVIFMRHERIEQSPGNPKVRIFALGYEGKLEKGNIALSSRHTEMLWVDLNSFQAEKYFSGGWLKGVKDYLAFNNKVI